MAPTSERSMDVTADRSGLIVGISTFLIVVGCLFTALRVMARRSAGLTLWWDDWHCFVGLPLALLPSIFNIVQTYNGLGRHMATLSMDEISRYSQILYVLLLFYNLSLCFFKLSILAFYCRIFPIVRWLRLSAWVIGTTICLWVFALEFVLIFRCHPMNLAWSNPKNLLWLGIDEQLVENCLDQTKLYIAQSAATIIFDIVIILLPTKLVWGLQMRLLQRVVVLGVFLMGFLVTVVTIVRLSYTVTSHDADLTFSYIDLGIWSASEPIIGIVCCSALTFGPYLRTIIDKIGSRSRSNDTLVCPHSCPSNKKGTQISGSGYEQRRDSDHFGLQETGSVPKNETSTYVSHAEEEAEQGGYAADRTDIRHDFVVQRG